MDITAITIIVVSTVLAIVFKVVIFRKIRAWMEQDLIKGLAGDDKAKLMFLKEKLDAMKSDGVARKELHERLTLLANEFEQSR